MYLRRNHKRFHFYKVPRHKYSVTKSLRLRLISESYIGFLNHLIKRLQRCDQIILTPTTELVNKIPIRGKMVFNRPLTPPNYKAKLP